MDWRCGSERIGSYSGLRGGGGGRSLEREREKGDSCIVVLTLLPISSALLSAWFIRRALLDL